VLLYVSMSRLINAILTPWHRVIFQKQWMKDTHHLDATDNPLSEHSLTAFRRSVTIFKSREVIAAMEM
jgi:hypothetical protein